MAIFSTESLIILLICEYKKWGDYQDEPPGSSSPFMELSKTDLVGHSDLELFCVVQLTEYQSTH